MIMIFGKRFAELLIANSIELGLVAATVRIQPEEFYGYWDLMGHLGFNGWVLMGVD